MIKNLAIAVKRRLNHQDIPLSTITSNAIADDIALYNLIHVVGYYRFHLCCEYKSSGYDSHFNKYELLHG